MNKFTKLAGILAVTFAVMMAVGIDSQAADYKAKGRVYTVNAKKNTDVGAAINKTIEAASKKASAKKIYTVKLNKGTYKLGRSIIMRSNVKLDVRGVTLNCSSLSSNMLCAYNTNSRKTGLYRAAKNISVIGGNWKANKKSTACIMRIAHSKNVKLENCVLDGGYALHQIETAAIDGLTVKKCTFKNMRSGATVHNGEKLEALQLDIALTTDTFQGYYMDGTPTKNVKVTGCTFMNVPRGVGSHSWGKGHYIDGVVISDNKFRNIEEEAIIAVNYSNCEIKGNDIEKCGAGIVFQCAKASSDSMHSTCFDGKKTLKGTVKQDMSAEICDNKISVTKNRADETAGIKLYGRNITAKEIGGDGKAISGEFPAAGITVRGNEIECQGVCIHLYFAKNCNIRNNNVKEKTGGKLVSAIMLERECSGINIDSNTVDDSTSCGILVQDSSSAGSISYNTITDSDSTGIKLEGSKADSICSNSIYAVDKTNACADGILIYKDSRVGTISDNTIRNMSGRSIKITNGGMVDDLGENHVEEGTIYYK